jgi:hypothetical protein
MCHKQIIINLLSMRSNSTFLLFAKLFSVGSLLLITFSQAVAATHQPEPVGELQLMRPKIPLWRAEIRRGLVIRSKADWDKALKNSMDFQLNIPTNTVDKYLERHTLPNDFDFTNNMIIAFFGGASSPPHTVEIVSVKDGGKTITVKIELESCERLGWGHLAGIFYYADAVAIKKTRKKIIFHQVKTNNCPGKEFKQNMTKGM